MADLLRQGAKWLEQRRAAFCSNRVVYRRGGTEAILDAAFGRTQYQVEDESGLRVGAQVTDFLILAEAFPFDQPQAGDRVVADGVVYEVMDLAGEGHWRWSDPYRTTMRIHTREVGTE